MLFRIQRNGQEYGPYTREDLERYVASGNVLPTDLTKSDEMTDWVPLAQVLGAAADAGSAAGFGTSTQPNPPQFSQPQSYQTQSGFSSPGFADPVLAAQAYGQPVAPSAIANSPYPDAPNLNWGVYLLLSIVTCTLFSKVFVVVQAAWLRRVQPNSLALFAWLGFWAYLIISYIVGIGRGMSMMFHPGTMPHYSGRVWGSMVVHIILLTVARFMTSTSLEEHFNGPEPVGLRLNPVLTFLFGGVYFQYHLNRINAMKQAARFGSGRPLY